MRQILLNIWMENKQIPILVIVKIVLILASILTGVLSGGFSYSAFFFWVALMLQILCLKPAPQVEFLLPKSDSDKKRFFILKNIWISGIYSFANTLGYILMISICSKYKWDGEMIFFIIVMTVFSFYPFLIYRMLMDGNGYFEFKVKNINQSSRRMNLIIDIETGSLVIGVFCILAFLMYKLDRLKYILFLGTGYWRIISLIVIAITFVLLTSFAWRHCKNITIGDYCD